MDYIGLYSDVHSSLLATINTSLATCNISAIAQCHLYASDMEKWISFLGNRNEVVLYKTALGEYLNSLYFMTCGLYRQSYISLRFFLEHMLFGVHLSTDELYFRLWCNGKQDLFWSEITDENKGILSVRFIDAFSPEFVDYADQLRNICKQLYREFSEYIHGNFPATQVLPLTARYDEERFQDIIKKIETLRYLITLILFVRYKDAFIHRDINTLEQSIIDSVGHTPEVLSFFKSRKGE